MDFSEFWPKEAPPLKEATSSLKNIKIRKSF